MNRRRFTLAALSSGALLAGCQTDENRPSRDATLIHRSEIRAAVNELEQAVNALQMRVTGFNAENWQDAAANLQTTAIRLQADVAELKRALGYESAEYEPAHPLQQ
jgi:outer membrane murein-binding lipoprotein Lpp